MPAGRSSLTPSSTSPSTDRRHEPRCRSASHSRSVLQQSRVPFESLDRSAALAAATAHADTETYVEHRLHVFDIALAHSGRGFRWKRAGKTQWPCGQGGIRLENNGRTARREFLRRVAVSSGLASGLSGAQALAGAPPNQAATATGRAPHALCDSILPRCLNTRPLRLQTGCLQECDHIGIEFRVVVQDGKTTRTSLGKRLTQLLHDPLGGRMTSDVEVQDSGGAQARSRRSNSSCSITKKHGGGGLAWAR